uniref:GYF domain-containing protein n=1 Tax=Photinus pyralis TaxID=7054 RepID=A0A1Y1M1L0_PHOPY
MYKRKSLPTTNASIKRPKTETKKKYSLDSDEEDNIEESVLEDNDIEGEEEGESGNIGDEKFTAFNMQEELEEGHFDKDGHFIWKNDKEVRDNWLDNIDWQKIKSLPKGSVEKGLGDESDDSDFEPFQEVEIYKEIIQYMKPKETINKALMRWGAKNKNLSSLERLKRKKTGTLDSNTEVTKLTELADKILSEAGNMDIYQETYEVIKSKIDSFESKKLKTSAKEANLDMYADDFDEKETKKLGATTTTAETHVKEPVSSEVLMWEYKWNLNDEKIEGPFDTHQMLKWVKEGYFKKGAFVRKRGVDVNFYSTNRIDFDLYL